MSFRPNSVLFDKGVIRRLYERRVRLALSSPPTLLQTEAANAYSRLSSLADQLYISQQTENILQRRTPLFATAILADTQTLKKGRYLRRWARRLREMSFSPEDAIVLAYGVFGVDVSLSQMGVEVVITTDLKLAAHFETNRVKIEDRFVLMIQHISEPYSNSRLPIVMTTANVLALT